MPSGLLSLTDEKLTQLKEQIIRILKSCDEQSLELHVFKKVYKDTYGKRFEVHFRELKSKKLKDVMEKLDYVTVLEQSGNGIIQIKLKDQVEDSSSVPGRVNSFSSTYSEESISLVYNTTQGPPMSLVAAAAFEGQCSTVMHLSFETPTIPPPPPLGDDRGNVGPFTSYLVHFCSPVGGGNS